MWSDLIILGHGLWLSVFSVVSLLQSPLPLSSITSSPLPGALDRWALGAVLYLMAHTVSRITPAIISLCPRLPRRAWDTRNTLLANWTWWSHFTVALGAWDTWCSRGTYISHLSDTLISLFSLWSSWSWGTLASWPTLSAYLSWESRCTWGPGITWRSVFPWWPRPTWGCHHLHWHLHARHVVGHSLIKDLDDLLADEVLDFIVIDYCVISW